jgi:hypothetical protein
MKMMMLAPPDSYVIFHNYCNIYHAFFIITYPPFKFPPTGGKSLTPSPVGEGWEGG